MTTTHTMPADDDFRWRDRRRHAQIPQALQDLTWGDLDRDPQRAAAIDDAHAWAEGQTTGLLLEGPVGTGKTRIAAVAANHCLRRRAVRWASAPQLVAQLSAGLGTAQHEDALELITHTGALILDDLDKTRPTTYAAEQLFLAIDTRIAHGAPLLVTTNLALREIATRYEPPLGEAIASRLAGYCRRRHVVGPDRRIAA